MRTPSVTTNTVDRITAAFLTPGDKLVAYTRVRADLELVVIVRKLALGRLTVGVIDLDEPGIIRGDELVTSGTPRNDDIDHALNTVANRELKRLDDEGAECEGHPAGPFDPMGATVYCDGSCRADEVLRHRAAVARQEV